MKTFKFTILFLACILSNCFLAYACQDAYSGEDSNQIGEPRIYISKDTLINLTDGMSLNILVPLSSLKSDEHGYYINQHEAFWGWWTCRHCKETNTDAVIECSKCRKHRYS